MRRKILFALAATAFLSSAPAAQAIGSSRLPCLMEEVIKVVDVPRDASMQLAQQWGVNLRRIKPGHGVDIGFRFSRCSSQGHWVGYIGYSEADLELTDGQLRELLRAADLVDFPDPPGIWSNPDMRGILGGLAGGLVFAALWLARRGSASARGATA